MQRTHYSQKTKEKKKPQTNGGGWGWGVVQQRATPLYLSKLERAWS